MEAAGSRGLGLKLPSKLRIVLAPNLYKELNKQLFLPGKPVACNFGLVWLISGLLWTVMAHYFRLLGFPDTCLCGPGGAKCKLAHSSDWPGPHSSDWPGSKLLIYSLVAR